MGRQMNRINLLIKVILIGLLIFTPLAFGSVELWAFSLMELGILLIIALWAIQRLLSPRPKPGESTVLVERTPNLRLVGILLFLFLLLVLLQMVPLPPGVLKVLSPRTYHLRADLTPSAFYLSFVPFATQLEFFKWLTLALLFFFLLTWDSLDRKGIRQLILTVFCVGVFEALYGMFEFFTGHKQILHLKMDHLITSVTGTFINRNAFAGYLLMVIPLSTGYLFSREALRGHPSLGWRHRLISLDGKSLLLAFGIILMILGLLFSASRMGIISLLLSFSMISFLLRNPERERGLSRSSILILGLAILWASWIGLDAVISRFFTTSESLEDRWRLWQNTWEIVRDYPLFGIGLGTFTQVFPMYRSFHIRGLVTHAENDFLQFMAEAGIPGIGILLALFLYLFYRAGVGIRSFSHRDPERLIGRGGAIGILALMFHSLVERNIQIPANAFLYTVIWGIVLRTSSFEEGRRRGRTA